MFDLNGDVVGDRGKFFVKQFDNFQRMPDAVKKIRIAKRYMLRPGGDLAADILEHHFTLHDSKNPFIDRYNRAVAAEMLAAAAGFRRAHHTITSARDREMRVCFDGREAATIRHLER